MRRLASAVVGLSIVACVASPVAASPEPKTAAKTIADARGTLAQGTLARRSAGPLYVSVVEADMKKTGAIREWREPGFELVLRGSERITAGTGPATDVEGGQAVFVQGEAVTSFEPVGGTLSYFVSLRSSATRSRALEPGRRVLYESADLPASATPAGSYQDTLVLLVLQPGAVVPPHMHGGIEPTYVIEGTIELWVAGRSPERLGSGDGETVLPDTPLLITNVGSTLARVLVMLATPEGRPVQTSASPP